MGYLLIIAVFIAGPFQIAGVALWVVGLILRHRGKVRMREDPVLGRPSTAGRVCVFLGIIFFATPLALFFIVVILFNME